MSASAIHTSTKIIKCAIYTRKSTDENLNTDFNSLDSQREYCQSFIKSREGEGWKLHPEEYNDPGFTGGNINRPGLRKLLYDARNKKFQVVVCYKYDRLSRNTKDFLHILEIFDQNQVAFVSVTQPIDTTSSVGRLMRSILMDFSQFEREMISERTRDKMAAMAKRGKWIGSNPILGYNYNPDKKLLEVNPSEAKRVKEIFAIYLKEKSLRISAQTANNKGYRMKSWIARNSNIKKGGAKFNKTNLLRILTNPVFLGKIRYKGQLYKGEHSPIIDEKLFNNVSKILDANNNGAVFQPKRKEVGHNFLLQGIIRCGTCGYAMAPNYAYSRGRKFFYYKCVSVSKMDPSACEVKSISAKEIDRFVLERLSFLAQNQSVVENIVSQSQASIDSTLPLKLKKKSHLMAELGRIQREASNLVRVLAEEGLASQRKGFIMDELDKLNVRQEEIKGMTENTAKDIQALEERKVEASVIRNNLHNFTQVFHRLQPKEKRELVRLFVKEAVFDKAKGKIDLNLRALPALEWDTGDQGAVLKPVSSGVTDGT